MRDVDGQQMRWLEAKAKEIGHVLKRAVDSTGKRYGFTLFLFSFDGPEFTYLSNAQRPDMVKVIEEFLARQKSGEADQLWHERN